MQNGIVRLVDQRKLPQQFVVAELRDYREVARAIKEMWIRGAPALGGAGGFGLALAALASPATTREEFVRELEQALEAVASSNRELNEAVVVGLTAQNRLRDAIDPKLRREP